MQTLEDAHMPLVSFTAVLSQPALPDSDMIAHDPSSKFWIIDYIDTTALPVFLIV